ncbi:MAG: hypothetical protein U5L07_02730 [Desulfobacterales bacterium]|nr:hypothetical protein [Desulfobacterales bacterium]
MNRKAVDALLEFREKNRYLPGLRALVGFRQGWITCNREERPGSKPGMTYGKLINLAMDAIFSFSDIPIRLCLFVGIIGMLICFGAFFYIILSKLLGIAPFGWSSTTISIFFIGFIELIFLGIMGEYIYRIFKETQNRPHYIIKNNRVALRPAQ